MGANSSTRSVRRTIGLSASCSASKTKLSSLMALGSAGSVRWPVAGSTHGTFLMARCQGSTEPSGWSVSLRMNSTPITWMAIEPSP